MSSDNLFPLIIFAGALVCTPGPANMLLMAAGAQNGVRRSLPLLAGVTFGKTFVHLFLALGLWGIVAEFPAALLGLKIAGAIYILWLAHRVLQIKIGGDGGNKSAPQVGFWNGLLVHPINPKAWAMVASAYGQFVDEAGDWRIQAAIVWLVFFVWQCAAHTFWCWCGARAAKLLAGARAEKVLMQILAALMVGAVLWALFN